MSRESDVLVVGAGPVGLTTAIALRRWDLRVRIVDKATGENREPRADVLFPRAGEALGAIGVGQTVQRNSFEMQSANIYGEGRHLGSFTVGRLESRYPRAMTIEQHDIERLLAEELARLGVTVEWRTKVTNLRVHENRAELTLRLPTGDCQQICPAWVVGCDGVRSTIRDQLGIPFDGAQRANMQVVQGNVLPSWHLRNQPGEGYFFLAPYRSVIAFPTPAGGYRIFCVRDDADPDCMDTPSLAELRDLVADAARLPELALTLTEPVWLSRARFADRVAAVLRCGRVLLAGDAAHSWAPIGGHGMNIGMLGAHNLAWKLAAVHRGQAVDTVLDSYNIEQRALAFGVIRDMRFNIMEALLPPLLHRLRSAFLRVALSSARFQRRGEWMMSDLGRHHRRSPLSWHQLTWSRNGLRAGDRIPDVTVRAAGERQLHLHQLLRYDRWTLLLAAARADAATLTAVRDACAQSPARIQIIPIAAGDAEAARQLGRVGELKLVRPDGYVGLVAPLDRVDVLRDYLATFLSAPVHQ